MSLIWIWVRVAVGSFSRSKRVSSSSLLAAGVCWARQAERNPTTKSVRAAASAHDGLQLMRIGDIVDDCSRGCTTRPLVATGFHWPLSEWRWLCRRSLWQALGCAQQLAHRSRRPAPPREQVYGPSAFCHQRSGARATPPRLARPDHELTRTAGHRFRPDKPD